MKKFLLLLCLISLCSTTAFAAKYKINTSGQVTSPNGKVQTNISPQKHVSDVYKNYYHQTYTQNNIVNANSVGTIDIVMDYSGSMYNWIEVAKQSMSKIVSQLPQSTKIGFRISS